MPKSPCKKTAALEMFIADASQSSGLAAASTQKSKTRAGRILYIECKSAGLTGPARVGRVTFSQTGRTLYYRGQKFQNFKGTGFKANYYNVDSGNNLTLLAEAEDWLKHGRRHLDFAETDRGNSWVIWKNWLLLLLSPALAMWFRKKQQQTKTQSKN